MGKDWSAIRQKEDQRRREYAAAVKRYLSEGLSDATPAAGPSVANQARTIWEKSSPAAAQQLAAYDRFKAAGGRLGTKESQALFSPTFYMPDKATDYDAVASGRAYKDQMAYQAMHRNEGYWDVAGNRPSVLSDNFLTAQIAALNEKIAQSKQADENWKISGPQQMAAYEKAVQTAERWKQMYPDRERGYKDPEGWSKIENGRRWGQELAAREYNWLMADYLLGNQSQDWQTYYDEQQARLEGLTDAEWDAEMARYDQQFQKLDWDALMNPQMPTYTSQTDKLTRQLEEHMAEQKYRSNLAAYRDIANKTEGTLNLQDYYAANIEGYDPQYHNPAYHTNLAYYINNAATGNTQNIIEQLTDGVGEEIIKDFTGILTDEDARQVRAYYDKGYDYLLPEEIAIYNDLLSTNEDMAAVFLLNMEQQLLARRNAYNTQETALLATDPVLGPIMSATTVATNTNPYKTVQTMVGAFAGAKANDPVYDLIKDDDTVRQARAKEWNDAMPAEVFGQPIGGTVYNTIMSAFDMAGSVMTGNAIFGKGSKAAEKAMLAIISSNSAANTTYNDIQKGYTNEQAIIHGLVDGLIEAWMERGFIDKLFDAGKGFAPRMLGSALAEGGEEIGTEILQTIGNEFAAYLTGNESEINKVYQAFKGSVPYGTDAGAETLKYYANQFALAGLSGFAMGAGTAAMTAGDAIANEIETRQMGADLQQNGDVEAVLQIAESFAEGTEANSAAKSVREELNKKHKVSNRKLGKMITAVTREVGEQNARELNQVLDDSIQERLVELGEDSGNAKKLAPVIRNIYQGRKITRAERAGINWTQNADQVVKEMSGITAEEAESAQVPGATEAPEGERVGQRWKTQTREKILRTTIDGMGRSAELASALTTKADAAVEGSAKKVQERQKGKPKLKNKEISYIDSQGAKQNATYEKVVKRNGKFMVAMRDAHNQVVEVEADAIDNAEAGLATIIEHAAHGAKHDMSAEEVNTLAAVYQEKGGDIKAVIRRFEDSYLAGYSGLQQPQGADTLDAIAYEQGAKEAAKDEEKRIEKTMRTHRNERPRVTWLGDVSGDAEVHGQGDEAALEAEYDNLTEGQQMVAEFSRHLAEQTGLNVVLFRSKARDGEYTTQNGSYDSATHTVYLDVNAGNLTAKDAAKARKEGTLGYAIMRTMGHEVTHAIEATSPTFYAQYREAVKQELMKAGKDWTGLVRAKLDNAVRDGVKLTYGGAVAEVVADASEYMLQDSAFVNNLDTSLKGKVKAVIKDFTAKLKAAFRNLTGGSAEARALRNDLGQYNERLQRLWDAAFVEMQNAGEAYEYPTPIVTDGDRIVDATEVDWPTGDAPMPTYRQYSEEEENAGAFVSYADEADQGTVQYSIRSLSDGTKYVHVDVDQQIFDGLPANEYGKAARNYIRDHFRNKVIGTNVRAYVRRDTENEYTLPAKKNIPPAMYEGKMKAATELDNLLDASVFLGNEEDDGRHPDAVRGWDKYSTVFEVNGRYFEGTVALKKIQKGDVFYDVTKIKDITGPMRAKYSNELQYPGQGDILMDNVPQPDDSVNGNIQKSERVQTETENPDISYSHRAGEETADELYEQYRTISMQLNEAREKKRQAERAMEESGELQAVYDLMNRDMKEGAIAYKELLEKYDMNNNQTDFMQQQANALYRKWEETKNREEAEKEKAAIKKTGKSEADYYREKAVKEFGYTPYFYDGGYLLPNGKMLNLSGEKGRHFGSRGDDHRVIGTVYANKSGSEAMIAFMHGGNIRMMPEAPGVDIASTIEPTAQQYATLRKFVREYAEDEYLNIDFTNDAGNVVANLEYEGRIYPDRVVNDIKHYFATGEIREQGISAFKYSRRTAEPDSASIREMLGGMQPTARMTETEKLLLKRYQEKLAALDEKEKQIEAQEQIIRTAPVPSDELTKAKNRYRIYRDQANRIARELGEMERNDGFARLMATSQEVVNRFLLGSAGSVADAAEALDAEIAELTGQLRAAEAEVNRAADGQRTAFARGLFDQKQLEAAAKKLKDAYGSRMSIKSISDRLALAYGELYATQGAEGAQRFMAAAKDLAYDLLKQNKYRYKSDVLELIANEIGVISLSDTDMQEIYSAGLTLSAYKKAVMPYIKVADSGSDLSSYASNAEYYGEGALSALLGDDTEGDLAMRLYNLITAEKAKEREIGYEGMTEEQLLGEVMADIAGVSLPLSQDSKTIDYLRKELLKYAGESDAAAQKIEQAISDARKATQRASGVWVAAVKELETAKAAVTYYRKLEEHRRLIEQVDLKNQITEQLKTKYAERLKKRIEKQRTEFREREQRAREYRHAREDVMKLRRKIGRDIKRINALRIRETDKKHVPQEMQHLADMLMQTFTEGSLATLAFSREKAESLASRYQALMELETDMAYFTTDEIKQDLKNMAELSKTYQQIKERRKANPFMVSLEDAELEYGILQSVDNVVSNVLHLIVSTDDIFNLQRNETFNEFATKTGEAIRQKDDYKLLKGGWGKAQTAVDELLRMGNVTPVYFMEHLDSPEMMAVFDEIRKGVRKAALIDKEGQTFVEEAKARHHYGAWVADGTLVMETSQKDPKTGKGHTIELTREEAAEIYAIAKREKANRLYQTEHLLYGGFRYKDASKKGSGKTQVSNTPHQLDAADIDKIGRWLTAEQKAYADELVGFLSTNMADYGNAASMAMYGYRKFTEQYYIPFHVAAEQRYQRGDEGPQGEDAGTGRIRNSPFTHKVQHKANATLVVGGLTDTVAEHIHKMATYAALVEPIENMKRLLNHKVMERDGTTNTIRALIGQKYGKASQDYMTNLLKDLNGAANGDERATDLVNRMVGAFKRGAVMASASVVLQQPTAMARAMAYISPKYFAQNPFYRPGKGTWDEMMKYAGTAVIKDMGKFDVGMGLTATQYISDEHLTAMEAYSRLKAESKWEAGKAAYKRAMDWLTAAPGKADQWTWGLIWKAVKAEQAALHPGMDQTSEEFLRMCGERFDDVIDHTQVYDSVITRSDLMRSKNEFHKIATSFMSEPTLSINMLYDAVMGKHSGKQRAAIIGSVITSQVLAGAMAALAQAWNDDEDKRNVLERYADRAAGNIRDNLNPLSMIPYVSDLMSMLEGYSVERPDMSALADILSYGKTFFTKATDPEKALTWKDYENFIGTLANMAGLPAKNISREIRRTRNLILNSQWDAPTGTGMAEALLENVPFYSTKNAAYYERIVAAEMKGDTQKAEDYREYMLLSKMVSENSLKNGLKDALRDAYIAGRAEEDAVIQYLMKIGAADDENDAWWEVDKWNEMRDEGIAAGDYRKYDDFLQAVETGENLKATIKEYMDHGVSKTTLAKKITDGFQQRLIDAKKAGKGYADLQARILTAYEALGYDRQQKLKDIQKWLKEP